MRWSAAKEPITAPGSAPLQDGGGETDRGHGVAWCRLGEHLVGRQAGELGAHGIRVRRAGDDEDALPGEGREAVHGSLEEGPTAAGEVEEELGVGARLSGHSRVPAPPAGTTAQKPGMLAMRREAIPTPDATRRPVVRARGAYGATARRRSGTVATSPPSRNESSTRQTPSSSCW